MAAETPKNASFVPEVRSLVGKGIRGWFDEKGRPLSIEEKESELKQRKLPRVHSVKLGSGMLD